MKYIVAPNGVFDRHITTDGNVEWDSTHYCPASKLTPAEATQFGVHPLVLVTPPPFDPLTQDRAEATPALVAGVWTQQWVVVALDADALAAKQAEVAAQDKAKAQAELDALDLKSIRSLREYVAARSDAPKFVKDNEAKAVELRGKLK